MNLGHPFKDLSGIDMLFTRDFTAAELAGRRREIAGKIGEDAHLLIASAPAMPGDDLVQDANFYYFCGLELCHAYLLVSGRDGRSTLFLSSRENMVGAAEDKLGFEDADRVRQCLQFDEVLPVSALTAALAGVRKLYWPHSEMEAAGVTRFGANGVARLCEEAEWDRAEPRNKRMLRLLAERCPQVEIADALPLIMVMRTIKSAAEIEVMRQAGQLSANVMIASMQATRPGVTENRLQAIAEYIFRDQGHCAPGYGIIAASGQNIWNGHYHRNNGTLHDGDVVLMDCGPDLRHYSSDIARIWPVSGTFSDWHRRVYGMISQYHKTLLELIKPGALEADIYEEAARRMLALCSAPGSPYARELPLVEQMIARKVGYINHAVGLSVHDSVDRSWREQPLRPGFVCVVDPMVWCEPERQYIRVEDTIVITDDGCERLTGAAPYDIAEIEAVMAASRRSSSILP